MSRNKLRGVFFDMIFRADDFIFEQVNDKQVRAEYTADCSNAGRSCCCTRSCTQNGIIEDEAQWGAFLEINAGIIQY